MKGVAMGAAFLLDVDVPLLESELVPGAAEDSS